MNLALAAISRQALSRSVRAVIHHLPGAPYAERHLFVVTHDKDDRPAVLVGADGFLVTFATVAEADGELARLVPDLPVTAGAYAEQSPGMILP